MPSTEQLRSRLLKKLSELFQLDQPDLDFGFYRIMHAKSQEVQDFIGADLLNIVTDAFGEVDEARKAELKAKIDKEIANAKEYGVTAPENSPKVKEAQEAYAAVKDTAGAEADVYDHLYRFFERYYDNGDFISRRYYTRETSGKAAPFAVPYNGEEVKLHWANADQYYIKSAEHFSNFSFDLRQAKEVRTLREKDQIDLPSGTEQQSPLRVHFRVVEATEGEHGNIKASEIGKRFFIIHSENPVAMNDAGELVVNFGYRPDTEKTGQENAWRDKRNAESVEVILERLQKMAASSREQGERITEYLNQLQVPAPTEKDKKRPLLAKYINQYTARNTMDYFIHKDLGGFLRRELDFYIKNEVMRLDDIENAEAPVVVSYLAKIKVLRKIAGKLIDFLAQLEDFQKKLWLKKKFVVETNYCITLDRVPEELYPEIAANEAQIEEWIKLFAIDEIQPDLPYPGFSQPLKTEFLVGNNKLVLDTKFFDEGFKARLLASIENFDEQCDGLLIHSENFQAISTLCNSIGRNVKTIYIDPPYNTGDDGFAYKDSYRHASWLTMLSQSISAIRSILRKDSLFFSSIDRDENWNLLPLFFSIFGEDNFVEEIVWQKSYGGGSKTKLINNLHEYIICFSEEKSALPKLWLPPNPETLKYYKFQDKKFSKRGKYRTQPLYTNSNAYRENLTFPLPVPLDCRPDTDEWKTKWDQIRSLIQSGHLVLKGPEGGWKYSNISAAGPTEWDGGIITPPKQWQWSWEKVRKAIINDELVFKYNKGEWTVDYKQYQFDENGEERGAKPSSILIGPYTQSGTSELANLFNEEVIKFPKPLGLIKTLLSINYSDSNAIVADFFAGSGTTGHAIVNLNRDDGGKRKYILVEMGEYFNAVLKPRIAKIVYSDNWKDGKPKSRHSGISQCFKHIRLESYEDTLNNLRLDHNVQRKNVVAAIPALKEDYILRYMLDVETRGSQSLLNIDAFENPTSYVLNVKKPGSDEYVNSAVDLIETFNYLIGLRVVSYAAPQEFTADFKRIEDPEVPKAQATKLVLDGKLLQIKNPKSEISDPSWWFRKVEGWVPKDQTNPNPAEAGREKVLIVWRKLTGNIEQDNVVLDEWFLKNRITTRDFVFDTIYVNGSNNLPNLKSDDENWKVRLIEEEFMKRMWNGENA